MINKDSKIYLSGHKGMVGSSILRLLNKKKFNKVIYRTKKQLDLLDQKKTFLFLKSVKPDVVIIAAAKVGGIKANNSCKAEFIYQNLQIQNNLIHGSYISGVKKLIFLGSSCIYPRNSKQPIKENYLMTNSLEPTNEAYAIAKIAGLKMIESYNSQYNTNFLCLMPCNLYGPNDNYDLNTSHFLPALIRKIAEAKIKNKKKVLLWGDGSPLREIMHVDDLADACLFFLKKNLKQSFINIGSGEEYSIKKYAEIISKIFGYNGKIVFNNNGLNGTPRKKLDCTIAKQLNWHPKVSFRSSIMEICNQYIKSIT